MEGETPHNFIYENAIDGKVALTKGKRLNLVKKKKNRFFSILELNPETGRTHQIRKHLSENGFPIVGDAEYGSGVNFFQKGLYLSATGLKFQHPVNSEMVELQIEMPKKFIIQEDFDDISGS